MPKGNYWILRIGLVGSLSTLQKSEFLKLIISYSHYFWRQNWVLCQKMSGKNTHIYFFYNSIISFGHVDSYAKTFLILYPPLENSTTPIAIMYLTVCVVKEIWDFQIHSFFEKRCWKAACLLCILKKWTLLEIQD